MTKFIFVLAVFFSLSSFAFVDVICWDKDCLKNGYTKMDHSTGKYLDFQCYNEGCEKSGWIVGGTAGLSIFSMCRNGGCFKEGWFEALRSNPVPFMDVICESGEAGQDCLKYGWTAYHRQTGLEYYTRCTGNDCRKNGWVTVIKNGWVQQSVCNNNDCFHSGWVTN